MAIPVSAPDPRRRRAHWNWFVLALAVLSALGVGVAMVAMFPLAMATDPCHDGTPDRICHLSAAGQNFVMLIPWLALLAGIVITVATGAVAARRNHSPLFGVPLGIIGYLAALPAGWHFAFTL